MTLAIGDLQGCAAPLARLLRRTTAAADESLWFCGDLVNRGPHSLRALQAVRGLGRRARVVLGNHDLHLLALACGARRPRPGDTVGDILRDPSRPALVDWLRTRPLAVRDGDFLMVHAGVEPTWEASRTTALAAEVEHVLRGPHWGDFLRVMYGNEPARWDDGLSGDDRLRTIVNVLTRLRFMRADGRLDLSSKAGPTGDDGDRLPWFDMPGRRTAAVTVVFGHWSTLGLLRRPGLIGLDTGCVWGGCLSAVRLESGELFQQACPRAATPGAD